MDEPLFFDIETDGLKDDVTRIWCITVGTLHFGPDVIEDAVALLHNQWVCGHNCINFDIPVIKKFYPWFDPEKIEDTFILSSLFEPDRNGHGLADWGEQFGIPKPKHEDWSQYSDEMRHRNIEDVRITKRVWEYLSKERGSGWDWEPAIKLEYAIAECHARQEANGVGFDWPAATKLYDTIAAEIATIEAEVTTQIPKRIVQIGSTVEKPFKKDGQLSKRIQEWLLNPQLEGHLIE